MPLNSNQVDTLQAVRYKDGWYIDVKYDGERPYLQIRFMAPCVVTKELQWQFGRKWMLSEHMTDTELVVTAFKACLAAEEHECREFFMYRDVAVFNMHIDLNQLSDRLHSGNIDHDIRKEKDKP